MILLFASAALIFSESFVITFLKNQMDSTERIIKDEIDGFDENICNFYYFL